MPKVKTNSGSKKRFALTGSGKIKRKHAYKSHILTRRLRSRREILDTLLSLKKLTQRTLENCSTCNFAPFFQFYFRDFIIFY